MASLTIRLLGPPQIAVDGQPISFRTRKVLALLIYLVVEKGLHSRESLMALLWPESSTDKASVTLRGTLSRLRKSLQPAGDLLISDGGNIGFDFEGGVDFDLDWLVKAVLPQTSAEDLSPILALDRGEFLAGFSLPDTPGYDNWAATQREACQRQVETVYNRLTQQQLADRRSDRAVDTGSRWVNRAPLSEVAYRRLMAAQALNGDRPGALRTYVKCRAILQEEFGIEPSRETAVLAEQIERDRVREMPALDPATVTSLPGSAPRLSLPFVGRSEEHRQLVNFYRRLKENGPHVVTVIGAAGVGKTWLLAAFRDWLTLDSPGVEIWQGRAFEMGGRLPYQPVVEAMRPRLDQENAPEDLLDDVWLAELSRLMPELRARYPDLPPPMSGDRDFVRSRLFEAMAMLGSALARGHAAVFILDDMQWAEADTMAMLHYMARRWAEEGAPILLLMTVRQENFAAESALREWLTRLGRDLPATRLLLDSLDGTAVEQIVISLSDPAASQETSAGFATWLWSETSGLPFFVEALLQMLVEQDILVPTNGTYDFASAFSHVQSVSRWPIPPGVREVILARRERLSKEAGALLLAAAVLGRTCTFERLRQVADLSEEGALQALETLLDNRLLTEQPSDWRPYTLAHDYIREVIYNESREARRRVFHRRALLALEAAGAPAAECAYHAQASLLNEPAFRFSLAAGSESFVSYAVQEALVHFDKAREIARRMETKGEAVDGELLASLYRQRGQVLELIQDDEAAQANFEEMMAAALRRQDPDLELAALISLSTLYGSYTGVFNPLKAKELALEALKKARQRGNKQAEAGALWALTGAEFYSSGDNNLIMEYGQQGLALARELGLKDLIGGIQGILSWSFIGQMQLQQAHAALNEAQAIWRELGNLQRLGEASRFMLIVYGIAGDFRHAFPTAEQLFTLSVSSGSRLDQLNALLWLANGNTWQGRFGQALDNLEKIGVLTKAIGYSNEEQAHEFGRTVLYLAAGAFEEAERWADRLYAQRETIMPTFIHFYLTEVARVKIALGKLHEGRAILDQLLASLPADDPISHNITTIAIAYGEANMALGQPEAIFSGLEERVRPYREAGFNRQLAEEYWLRGRASLTVGHYDEAQEALLKARETAEAQEERPVLWRILVSLADVEEACDNETAASGFLDQAWEVVNYITEHAGGLREMFLAWPEVQDVLTRKPRRISDSSLSEK